MMDVQLLDKAESREGQAGEVIEADAGFDAAVVDDQSIYRERRKENGFDKTPWSAYFYYVGEDPLGTGIRPLTVYPYVSHHGPIDRSTLKLLITQLALNARESDPGKQNPKPYTSWFKWTRKSYIIMLVDDPTYAFDKGNAVTIASADDGNNHTFFDGADFADIELPQRPDGAAMENVTAVCFTNHMKRNAAGDDLLADEEQRFQVSFSPPMNPVLAQVTLLARLRAVLGGQSLLFGEDDGGTNMGPPVPPP